MRYMNPIFFNHLSLDLATFCSLKSPIPYTSNSSYPESAILSHPDFDYSARPKNYTSAVFAKGLNVDEATVSKVEITSPMPSKRRGSCTGRWLIRKYRTPEIIHIKPYDQSWSSGRVELI